MKKRNKIRLVSFTLAAFCFLILWGTINTVRADRYEKEAKLHNQQALTALSEYMDNIETALIKSRYASSPYMLSLLTAELQRDSSGAKESLSALSSGETELYNTYKFLSQVGEYTAALNKKLSAGEELTEEETEILKNLQTFSSGLSVHFDYMADLMKDSYLSFEDLDKAISEAEQGSETMISYMDSVGKAEQTMTDFPTLIYDGPFSDNILTKESVLLGEEEEISEEDALYYAAGCLDTNPEFLVTEDMSDGKIPCYNFRTDFYYISVTRQGGYINEILSSPEVGEEKLTGDEAVKIAAEFLVRCGYEDMTPSYYSTLNGVCTVNFAYKHGSFICYPDLIKVSVTVDSGRIAGLEASDYIMNHHKREIPAFGISPEEAAAGVSDNLTVKKVSAAVIPTPSGNEKYTYELLCTADDGNHVLIYKNIENGNEEDILLLLYADNGTLTK